MKLSELIQKIYDTEYNSECYVKPIRCSNGPHCGDYRIRVEYGDGYWGDYEFYIVDGKISDNHDMDLPRSEFKWLYKLWVDEVVFEDDLTEKDIW
jgi:hypothetical protein